MSFFNLEFGSKSTHKALLQQALDKFSFNDQIVDQTPFIYGPAEPKTTDGDYFYNIGVKLQYEGTWYSLKKALTDYVQQPEFLGYVDIDILLQLNGSNNVSIINPKAIHLAHSLKILSYLNPNVQINNQPLDFYINNNSIFNQFMTD
ncbi:MAG: hypothetical protein VXX85_00760 [Candidatus Margulisiibacteriota bacterium]|nr:hypothetical protein [Candidatus Margulisiibacteriota bacterium]